MTAEAPAGCRADEVRVSWSDVSHVHVDFDAYIRHGQPVHAAFDGVNVDVEVHTKDP
jgi:hypothetical protein